MSLPLETAPEVVADRHWGVIRRTADQGTALTIANGGYTAQHAVVVAGQLDVETVDYH